MDEVDGSEGGGALHMVVCGVERMGLQVATDREQSRICVVARSHGLDRFGAPGNL
jgi:hypothetical protein